MAKSSGALPFDAGDDQDESLSPDNTCPECGMDSVTSYVDRYSTYEYCTNCDWTDEDDAPSSSREPLSRRDRGYQEA